MLNQSNFILFEDTALLANKWQSRNESENFFQFQKKNFYFLLFPFGSTPPFIREKSSTLIKYPKICKFNVLKAFLYIAISIFNLYGNFPKNTEAF